MQSCASAAKLRSGGPILPIGMTPRDLSGIRHLERRAAYTRDDNHGHRKRAGKSLFARDCVVGLRGLEPPTKRLSAAMLSAFEHFGSSVAEWGHSGRQKGLAFGREWSGTVVKSGAPRARRDPAPPALSNSHIRRSRARYEQRAQDRRQRAGHPPLWKASGRCTSSATRPLLRTIGLALAPMRRGPSLGPRGPRRGLRRGRPPS